MNPFVFETTPKIICAPDSNKQLGDVARNLGIRHALIVTDAHIVKAGLLTQALAALKQAGIATTICSDVQADPPEAVVLAAVEQARQAGIDGVIGFGGGSSLDTAKLVALLARTPQDLNSIYGVGLAQGARWPLVQLPTTAGTGSEVTPIAIVTTPSHEKKGVVSSQLYPDVAVLDSLLTLNLPPAVTAMTGVDAMVHAIEAYTSKHKKNIVSDTLAVQALQLLYTNLPLVLANGQNVEARQSMLLGSLLAGMAFANAPVAAVHALAYPLGGHYRLPHGLTNSLVLLPVLRFNLQAAEKAYAQLGRAIVPSSMQQDDAKAAQAFVRAMGDLVATMPYAQNLQAAGVKHADLPMLATDAMQVQRLLVNNPREVTHADALALYTEAFA